MYWPNTAIPRPRHAGQRPTRGAAPDAREAHAGTALVTYRRSSDSTGDRYAGGTRSNQNRTFPSTENSFARAILCSSFARVDFFVNFGAI